MSAPTPRRRRSPAARSAAPARDRKLRVCIAGAGLIGGSLGLALQRLPWVGRVTALCRRPESARLALQTHAVHHATCDAAEALAGQDLVVLAAPLGHFEALLRDVARHADPGTVVTDVGSTKGTVGRLADRLLPRRLAFVGSHPIAGKEKTGVLHATADLFADHACVVCPSRRSTPAAIRLVERLWTALGMRVTRMAAADHDRILAQVSHLPHVLASLLVLNAADDELVLVGPGFLDTTRVAGGDADLWTDILRTNPRAMLASLDRLARRVRTFRELLAAERWPAVRRQLDQARVRRQQLRDPRCRKTPTTP